MAKQRKNKVSVGRKELPDGEKKIGVSIYIKKKVVDQLGGRTKVATRILDECNFLNIVV